MTRTKFKLPSNVLESLKHLTSKQRFFYELKCEHILAGVYFDSTQSSSTGTYVEVFIQPLFVPASTFVFNLGERCGRPTQIWDISKSTDMNELALKLLPTLTRVHGSADSLEKFFESELLRHRLADGYAEESLIGVACLLGRYDVAADVIKSRRARLAEYGWQGERRLRYDLLLGNIEGNTPEQCKEILLGQVAQTRKNLLENCRIAV